MANTTTQIQFPNYVPAVNDYTVKANQSTLDVALQLYGSIEGLVALCAANNFALAQLVPIGAVLSFDRDKQQTSASASYMALNARSVVTWHPLLTEVEISLAEYEAAEYEPSEFA